MDGTDHQYAAAHRATDFLISAPHAASQSGGHTEHLVIYRAQQILAHGEHGGFRSVVPLRHQMAGSPGHLRLTPVAVNGIRFLHTCLHSIMLV